jgi:hypothetical protein
MTLAKRVDLLEMSPWFPTYERGEAAGQRDTEARWGSLSAADGSRVRPGASVVPSESRRTVEAALRWIEKSDAVSGFEIFTRLKSGRKSPRKPRTRAVALIALSAGLPERPAHENAVCARVHHLR